MRLVSLVNLCTLHLSLISKLCTEFSGILSRLLGKVFYIPLIDDIFFFLPMKMRIGPAHRRIGGLRRRLDTANFKVEIL